MYLVQSNNMVSKITGKRPALHQLTCLLDALQLARYTGRSEYSESQEGDCT
jgi:hypothetical protein